MFVCVCVCLPHSSTFLISSDTNFQSVPSQLVTCPVESYGSLDILTHNGTHQERGLILHSCRFLVAVALK